jgi:hypothetical protein
VLTRAEYNANPPPDPNVGGSTGTPPPVTLKRVMCLGDSLTEGNETVATGFRTYRGKFAQLLTAGGVEYDLVGTRSLTPASGGNDPHHEAYGGAGIDSVIGANNITDRLPTILAESVTVDIIVMLLAWNDVYNASQNIGTRYASLAGKIRAAKPDVKLLLVTLPPTQGNTEAATGTALPPYSTVNTAIRALASGNTQVAEGATASYVSGDYQDPIHLLQSGADKLAFVIYNRLAALGWISATAVSPPPVPTPDVSAALSWIVTDVGGLSWFATGASDAPVVLITTLPNAAPGVAYSATLTASGSPAPTWSIVSGSLPTGLSLNSTTGVISGTPTGSTATFTARATNSQGTDDQALTLTVTGTPQIITQALPAGTPNLAYTATLAATGTAPIVWSVTAGVLPPGLALNPASGVISGTPTAVDAWPFTVAATGPAGTDDQTFEILIGIAPIISTTTLATMISGTPYSVQLQASGAQPITWSVPIASLPAGIALSGAGLLSGTPSAVSTGSMTVTATNAAGTDTQALSWTVLAVPVSPVITTSTLPAGTVGTAYSQTLAATGAATITWSIAAGALPTGLSLNASTGAITGTPTEVAARTFTARATNASGTFDRVLSLSVNGEAFDEISGGWGRFIRQ